MEPTRIILQGDGWRRAKGIATALRHDPVVHEVVFREYKNRRSDEQNEKLHAMLGDIARQKLWDGERLTIEQWKRLLVAGWMMATNRRIKIVTSLDRRSFTPLFQRTSDLSVTETIELIEFIYAWGAENEIRFKEAA